MDICSTFSHIAPQTIMQILLIGVASKTTHK
jgi:hypothetical protein